MVRQGDIILVSFDPSLGHEQRKTRPALIISNDSFNRHCGGMAIALPISHAKEFPLHIDLPDGLITNGKVLCDQIKAIDLNIRPYQRIETVYDDFLQYILEVVAATMENQ